MMKYRIREVNYENGDKKFFPEYKGLFKWKSVRNHPYYYGVRGGWITAEYFIKKEDANLAIEWLKENFNIKNGQKISEVKIHEI